MRTGIISVYDTFMTTIVVYKGLPTNLEKYPYVNVDFAKKHLAYRYKVEKYLVNDQRRKNVK